MGLQSYKPYARVVTLISGIIVIIASLDATQVINIFPQYANEINTILMIAGLLAPAISQELRVVRAEDLVKEDMLEPSDVDEEEDENIHIHIVVDGDDILEKMEDEDEVVESDVDGA